MSQREHWNADVIIVGGSLGGITAANWLAKTGRSVIVLERSPQALAGRGAGIVLHPSTARFLLDEGNDLEEFSIGTNSVRYLDEFSNIVSDQKSHFRYVSYRALHSRLVHSFDAASYRLGQEVVDFSQDGKTASVTCADGSRLTAGLLVFADGIRSAARKRLLPESTLEYSGYIAWRGTVPYSQLTDVRFRPLHDAITYSVTNKGHFLTYPIGGRDGEELLLNWLWYRNFDEDRLDEVLTDKTGFVNQLSVQPGLLADAATNVLCRDAAADLPDVLTDIVIQTAEPFIQSIVDLSVPQMVFGRTCLLGDSAFVARPHAAAGTAKACEESANLATSLSQYDDIETALSAWEVEQIEIGSALVKRSRRAGERIQFEGSWKVGEPLPFGLHWTGDSEFDVP